MFKITTIIILPLLCCTVFLSSVSSQRPQTFYHYPVPSNPVDFSAPRSHFSSHSNSPQRQSYQHYHHVPQQKHMRIYYNMVPVTNAHAPVNKQFSSPVLENAAFVGALAHHGYDVGQFGGLGAASAPVSVPSVSLPSAAAVGSETHSLNVKLPLPLGISPISVAPLPLQAGSPYDKQHDYVTSYGTREFQRFKK